MAYRWAARAANVLRLVLRRPHEPDFAAFALFAGRRGIFLDVGANVGQSAVSFRAVDRARQILSIEANPLLEPDLRFVKRFVRRFDFRICAASDAAGRLTLHVPRYRGLAITGEASLDPAMTRDLFWLRQQDVAQRTGSVALHTVEVQSMRLDDLAVVPAFVKLDVQGFELQALKGLAATLAAHRPVVLVECTAITGVTEFLGELGYRPFTYLPTAGRFEPYDGRDTLNVFFLHSDEAVA